MNKQAEILLVHYPVNAEAPFSFSNMERVNHLVFEVNKIQDTRDMIFKFNPEVVLCSGWGNSFYIKIVKELPSTVKKVLCFDNPWKGNIKQLTWSLLSHFNVLRNFIYAWVPGSPQKLYALKLGFKTENIFTGLYPADSDLFITMGKRKLEQKGEYPKIMMSVARYIKQKDLPTLWLAFIAANEKTGNKWQLNCIGFGELFDSKIENPRIRHLGFKQPGEMEPFILEAGIYVLPSIYEPWGVAVHEMALSALPMVLSDKVGAATMFLTKENGFSFKAGDVKGLTNVFIHIMRMSDEELWRMASKSFESGMQLSSNDWSQTLKNILNDNQGKVGRT